MRAKTKAKSKLFPWRLSGTRWLVSVWATTFQNNHFFIFLKPFEKCGAGWYLIVEIKLNAERDSAFFLLFTAVIALSVSILNRWIIYNTANYVSIKFQAFFPETKTKNIILGCLL